MVSRPALSATTANHDGKRRCDKFAPQTLRCCRGCEQSRRSATTVPEETRIRCDPSVRSMMPTHSLGIGDFTVAETGKLAGRTRECPTAFSHGGSSETANRYALKLRPFPCNRSNHDCKQRSPVSAASNGRVCAAACVGQANVCPRQAIIIDRAAVAGAPIARCHAAARQFKSPTGSGSGSGFPWPASS
jgi:hypothetical protein